LATQVLVKAVPAFTEIAELLTVTITVPVAVQPEAVLVLVTV
jgi:hypothetical protein